LPTLERLESEVPAELEVSEYDQVSESPSVQPVRSESRLVRQVSILELAKPSVPETAKPLDPDQ